MFGKGTSVGLGPVQFVAQRLSTLFMQRLWVVKGNFAAKSNQTPPMKKLFLSALLLAGFNAAQAQKIEAGVNLGYGTTWLINSNVSDQGPELDPEASFAPIFGLQGEYHISDKLAIHAELDLAMVTQKYKGEQTGISAKGKDKLSYFEVPILVRKYMGKLFFVELGPKFSFLMSAKESIDANGASVISDNDVKEGYKKTVVSAALGFGVRIPVAPKIHVNAGLRLAYGLTDATQEFSQTELMAKGNNLSVGTTYAHMNQQGDFSYKSTHLATGYIMVGATYEL
jgi:hypothetical protein